MSVSRGWSATLAVPSRRARSCLGSIAISHLSHTAHAAEGMPRIGPFMTKRQHYGHNPCSVTSIVENKLATVDFICVDGPHIERGLDVPDGYGALKLNGRRWAYCSAALPHEP